MGCWGQLVDSFVNKKIEFDITLPELESYINTLSTTPQTINAQIQNTLLSSNCCIRNKSEYSEG